MAAEKALADHSDAQADVDETADDGEDESVVVPIAAAIDVHSVVCSDRSENQDQGDAYPSGHVHPA